MATVTPLKSVLFSAGENDGLRKIAKNAHDVHVAVAHDAAALKEALPGAEILIANNSSYDPDVARIVRDHGHALRWIAFSTSGVEQAERNGLPAHVTVTNAPGVKAPTVAEHAMALLLASFRAIRKMDQAREQRLWARREMNKTIRSLEGATLVLVGYSSIGREIARKAKAFDMHVIAVTRGTERGEFIDEICARENLHAALARADALMLAARLGPDTYHLIGADEIAAMKPDAAIVNISRGEIIDEPALVAAIKAGRPGSVALDVVEEEPLPAASELWGFDNVLISPHVAGGGSDGYERFSALFFENVRRYRESTPLLHIVAFD